MKLEGLDHPKTLDFAALLQIELPTAIGHLELLWAFTGKKAPQGNIGKWPDGAIARACFWMGDPQRFMQSLLQARLIEADPEHRYIVHDWHEHAPRWVRAKLAKAKLQFIGSVSPTVVATTDEDDDEGDEDVDSAEPTTVTTTVAPSKRSEAKRSEEQAQRSGAAPQAPVGKQPTPEAQMAIALRDLGVTVTSMDPVLISWVKEFTTQQAVDAVGIARIRKPHPEPIHPNYLDKILRQPARPPPATTKLADRITWRPPPDESETGCTPPNTTPSSKH